MKKVAAIVPSFLLFALLASRITAFQIGVVRNLSFSSSIASLSSLTSTKGILPLSLSSSSNDIDNDNDNTVEATSNPPPYPRAAVAVAVRCYCYCGDHQTQQQQQPPQPHYLLIQRGTEPNKGKWSLPGGKLEWGETALEGAKRELAEETKFETGGSGSGSGSYDQNSLVWCPDPYTTADSIIDIPHLGKSFHYLIAVCFAELRLVSDGNADDNETPLIPPKVTAADDAVDARWWSMKEILTMEDNLLGTPDFVERMKRTEFLYQKGVLLTN